MYSQAGSILRHETRVRAAGTALDGRANEHPSVACSAAERDPGSFVCHQHLENVLSEL